MNRIVEAELLDTLPPQDPRAVRSRRDLRRVNAWMGNHGIMAKALMEHASGPPEEILELGAGDGHLLLRVAQKLSTDRHLSLILSPSLADSRRGEGTASGEPQSVDGQRGCGKSMAPTVTLLDRQAVVSTDTLAAFAKIGWRAQAVVADILDRPPPAAQIVVANLFLHHFEDASLAWLLAAIPGRAELFVAVEPHRFRHPHLCGQLLRLIGCNSVTRHDAGVSVRAGFLGDELSALWPDGKNWRLTERRAGLFSHLFVAKRIS